MNMLMRLHGLVWIVAPRCPMHALFAYLAGWLSTSLCPKLRRHSVSSTSGSLIETGSRDVTSGQEEKQQQSFPNPGPLV